MPTRKKKQPKHPPREEDKFDFRHHAGRFDLRFLHPQASVISYQNELHTAEEKSAYYEDLIQNNGQEDTDKIAKDCMKKAGVLLKKVDCLEEDEAQPLTQKIAALVDLANDLNDPVPPDVLASQLDHDVEPIVSLTPELEKSLSDMGLIAFKSTQDSDDASTADAKDNDSEYIKDLKKKANFWKNIHKWSPDEQRAYYICGSVKPADWVEAVFVRAQKHQSAAKFLSWETRQSMERLLILAEMGNEYAAREAVDVLEKFVRLLNIYAKTSPEVFRKVAGRLQSWPVVYSPHPRLNQLPQTIAAEIKLGSGIDYEFSPNTKWNPNDKGCKIAMHLYEHIKMMRQHPESNEGSPCFQKAINLPDIKEPGSVKAWWDVAKEVLLFAYPKPEEVEELRDLTNIKNRFKVRAKILECMENRFSSLFPKENR